MHGFYAETEAIVEFREGRREVALAGRNDALRPHNASRRDVRHILEVAANHFDELVELWRSAHA